MLVGGQAQRCVRTPRHRRTNSQIAACHARGEANVAASQIILQRGRTNAAAGAGARAAADRKVGRIQQPGAKLALGRTGVYPRALGNHQIGRRRLDKAAVAAQVAAARAQVACNFCAPCRVAQVRNHLNAPALARTVGRSVGRNAAGVLDAVAGHQAHHAALRHQARGVDHPAVFHHPGLQAAGRLGRQDDQAAWGLHRVAVVHQRSHGGRSDQDIGQAAFTADLQLVALARSQGHCAHLGQHYAPVAHLGRQQGDVAAVFGAQRALIDHAARRTPALQHVVARHKVGVADLVGGGRQRAYVHAGAWRKVHAVGVAQEHLAIGIDLAKNLAGRAAQHPVQNHAAGLRLVEVHLGRAAHVKALPVDSCTLAGLQNVHHALVLANADAARRHLAAHWQLIGRRPRRMHQPGAYQRRHQRLQQRPKRMAHTGAQPTRHLHSALNGSTGTARPRCACVFRHGHTGAAGLVPQDAVNLVHAALPAGASRS